MRREPRDWNEVMEWCQEKKARLTIDARDNQPGRRLRGAMEIRIELCDLPTPPYPDPLATAMYFLSEAELQDSHRDMKLYAANALIFNLERDMEEIEGGADWRNGQPVSKNE